MSPITIKTGKKLLTLTAVGLPLVAMVGCGGSKQPEDDTPIVTQPPAATTPLADAGRDFQVLNSTLVQLDGSGSQPAERYENPLTFQWRQLSGPTVQFLAAADAQSATPRFIAPSVSSRASIELELIVSQQDNTSDSDTITVDVEPCQHQVGAVYDDCIAPEFGPFTAYESNAERGAIHQVEGVGDYHVQWQTLDTGQAEHGQVVEVTWNANDPAHASDTNGWFGIATMDSDPDNGSDLSQFAQGTLSFDMRVIYHETPNNPTPFIVKMECGWPCSSDELAIPNAESSYEWQTYTYSIANLIASGLDINAVTFPFIIQPLWQQQEQEVTVQIDNVHLAEEYTPAPPMDGCPKAGSITYTLARSSNPTADEQDAYGQITRVMDEAVKHYNCYTNLQRSLNVSYNPSVATADGSANGSIRFGSRASMHHVTAMHEISHVLGVGTTTGYASLVRDGIYTGTAATAQLREISGIADDEIHSDGTHFWPHGLNYTSEGQTQQDLINHCLIVEAIVSDLR